MRTSMFIVSSPPPWTNSSVMLFNPVYSVIRQLLLSWLLQCCFWHWWWRHCSVLFVTSYVLINQSSSQSTFLGFLFSLSATSLPLLSIVVALSCFVPARSLNNLISFLTIVIFQVVFEIITLLSNPLFCGFLYTSLTFRFFSLYVL